MTLDALGRPGVEVLAEAGGGAARLEAEGVADEVGARRGGGLGVGGIVGGWVPGRRLVSSRKGRAGWEVHGGETF